MSLEKHKYNLEQTANTKDKEIVFLATDAQITKQDRYHVDMEMIETMISNFVETAKKQVGKEHILYRKLLNLKENGADSEKIRFVTTPKDQKYVFTEDLEKFAEVARAGHFDSGKAKATRICETFCDYICWCICHGPYGNEICRQECREDCREICTYEIVIRD